MTLDDDSKRDRAFAHQRTLFTVSATMVGVCLTAVALIRVVENLSTVRFLSRTLLGVDALVFLVAAWLSFMTMRAHVRGAKSSLYLASEIAVLVGIVIMTLSCAMLVFTLV